MDGSDRARAVTRASLQRFQLAEGPVWHAGRQRLLWVDIVSGLVFEGRLTDGVVTETARHEFAGMVGAVAPAADGRLLVAAQEHLIVLHPDGTRDDGPRVVPVGAQRRLNDAAVDPAGRLLVGTLSLAGESSGEVLVRLEDDGRLTTVDDDLSLSNGLAWSADGRLLYSVDTLRRTVFVRDYSSVGPAGESGARPARRVHLELTDGFPDGIALDAQGHLWVAVWGAGEVRRYSPEGRLGDRVRVPAPHTSSLAFAGADLRTLVITTARVELTADQLRDHPDSGSLFTTRVDVPGLPTTLWSGLGAR